MSFDAGQVEAIPAEGAEGRLGLHGHRIHARWLMTAGLFALLLMGLFAVVH